MAFHRHTFADRPQFIKRRPDPTRKKCAWRPKMGRQTVDRTRVAVNLGNQKPAGLSDAPLVASSLLCAAGRVLDYLNSPDREQSLVRCAVDQGGFPCLASAEAVGAKARPACG